MKLKFASSVTLTQTGAWPPSATNIVNRILGMLISIKNNNKQTYYSYHMFVLSFFLEIFQIKINKF